MSAALSTLFGLAMIATAYEMLFVLGRRIDERFDMGFGDGAGRFVLWPIAGAFFGGGAAGAVVFLVIWGHQLGAWVLAALGGSR